MNETRSRIIRIAPELEQLTETERDEYYQIYEIIENITNVLGEFDDQIIERYPEIRQLVNRMSELYCEQVLREISFHQQMIGEMHDTV